MPILHQTHLDSAEKTKTTTTFKLKRQKKMLKLLWLAAVGITAASAASSTANSKAPPVATNAPASPSTWVAASSKLAEKYPELKGLIANTDSHEWTLYANGTSSVEGT